MTTNGPQELSATLLDSIRDGTYPDSEEVISANLGPDALKATIQLLRSSEEELQTEIRRAIPANSPDVDKWIAEARQVQADIERSKRDARDIVQKHEAKQLAGARVEDANAKVRFLHAETEYNESILAALRSIREVSSQVFSIGALIDQGDLRSASSQISNLEGVLRDQIARNDGRQAWTLLASRVSNLRARAHKALLSLFDEHVKLESDGNGIFTISSDVGNRPPTEQMDLGEVLEGLKSIDAVDDTLSKFSKKLSRQFLQFLLSKELRQGIQRHGGSLKLTTSANRSFEDVIDDIETVVEYVQGHLPALEGSVLASRCVHYAIPLLVNDWLSSSIPADLQEMQEFKSRGTKVESLIQFLTEKDFKEVDMVKEWQERIPRAWLTRRRTAALDSVRKSFLAYRGSTKSVERVERGRMSKEEISSAKDTAGWNDWDEGWSREKEDQTADPNKTDEDVSGWDFEDTDDRLESKDQEGTKESTDLDESDAWGWGDDDDEKSTDHGAAPPQPSKTNGSMEHQPSADKEIILRETYNVTEIPDHILDVVSQQLQTANKLNAEDFKWLHSASPSVGLRALPALVFAMFRATAPSFYETAMSTGNIRLYNDCLYLAEAYRKFADGTQIPSLNDDLNALERFARTAYAREMDTQRTILGDLLDGTQGFSGCNEYPLSAECDTAISSTIDRIEAVHAEWKGILSHSALLQSTGSLVATAVDKVIKDIEDMEDISEAESQRLAGYCNQMTKLDALFTPDPTTVVGSADEPVPMTAVYVSNWLRFQYLANILESSLVDIKYLWTEGELSLEFSADEVIDLIKALFADSHHRKSAISEIRRHQPS